MERALLASVVLGLVGCVEEGEPDPSTCDVVPERGIDSSTEGIGDVVAGVNGFGHALYGQLASAEPEANLAFSATSIASVLAMAQVGAGGATATELAGALGMGDDTAGYQHAFGAFLQDLDLPGIVDEGCYTTETSAAQAAFLRSDLTLQEAFESQLLADYGAAPQALEAEDPVGQINGWVDTETQGHIPSLLEQGQITPDIALVLVNAVYFRGDWAQPFDPQWTASSYFTKLDGSQVSVEMMDNLEEDEFEVGRAAEIDGGQVIELPYKGGQMSLVIVLPDAPDGLLAMEKDLDSEIVDAWFAALDGASGSRVALPKITLDWKKDILGELIAQMPSLSDGGDFTNMIVDDAPGLAFVQHEATMQWDEQGTVATAATAGGFADAYEEYPRVDHPFLFFLRDDVTGMVLFQGRVVDPSAP
jgi:serpin B